jgi:hypothetical protein
MSPKELVSFLVGYIIGELGLTLINKANAIIMNKLAESLNLVHEHLLRQVNLSEAVIEAL